MSKNQKNRQKEFASLRAKFMKQAPSESVKIKDGKIINWDKLSPEIKDWLENG